MKEGSVQRGTQPSKELISIPCIHTTWCKNGNFHNPIHFLTGSENFINTVRCPHRSNSFPWLLLGNIHISSDFEVQVNCPRVHGWSHFPIRHRDAADQNQLLFCLKIYSVIWEFLPIFTTLMGHQRKNSHFGHKLQTTAEENPYNRRVSIVSGYLIPSERGPIWNRSLEMPEIWC